MPDDPTANVIPLRPPSDDWPTPPRAAAFTGLAGEIVSAIEPIASQTRWQYSPSCWSALAP